MPARTEIAAYCIAPIRGCTCGDCRRPRTTTLVVVPFGRGEPEEPLELEDVERSVGVLAERDGATGFYERAGGSRRLARAPRDRNDVDALDVADRPPDWPDR